MKLRTSTPHETSIWATACPDPFARRLIWPHTFSSWGCGVREAVRLGTNWETHPRFLVNYSKSLILLLNGPGEERTAGTQKRQSGKVRERLHALETKGTGTGKIKKHLYLPFFYLAFYDDVFQPSSQLVNFTSSPFPSHTPAPSTPRLPNHTPTLLSLPLHPLPLKHPPTPLQTFPFIPRHHFPLMSLHPCPPTFLPISLHSTPSQPHDHSSHSTLSHVPRKSGTR